MGLSIGGRSYYYNLLVQQIIPQQLSYINTPKCYSCTRVGQNTAFSVLMVAWSTMRGVPGIRYDNSGAYMSALFFGHFFFIFFVHGETS